MSTNTSAQEKKKWAFPLGIVIVVLAVIGLVTVIIFAVRGIGSLMIHLMPEEAYGMPDPAAIFTLEIAQLPGSEELEAGQQVYLSNQFGQPFPVKVVAKDDKTITFDANHEMAGKELNFTIELVSVEA